MASPNPTTTSTPPPPMISHRPNLKLELATESDIRAISDVWYACFPDPALRKMFPHTPTVQQWWDDANRSDMLHKPEAQYIVVRDVAPEGRDRVVGYAKWFVPVGEQRLVVEERFPPWSVESDRRLCEVMFGFEGAERKRLMRERQYYYLCALGTIPQYRRQGVGGMLVGWGTERADRDGLECFVDASAAGKPVYERFGFVGQEPFVIPGEGFTCTSYVRPKKGDV